MRIAPFRRRGWQKEGYKDRYEIYNGTGDAQSETDRVRQADRQTDKQDRQTRLQNLETLVNAFVSQTPASSAGKMYAILVRD